jgi:hypothetical protein
MPCHEVEAAGGATPTDARLAQEGPDRAHPAPLPPPSLSPACSRCHTLVVTAGSTALGDAGGRTATVPQISAREEPPPPRRTGFAQRRPLRRQ